MNYPAETLIEHTQVKRQIATLLDGAKRNEQIYRRFQELEFELLGADSARDMLQTLLNRAKALLNLEVITLALFDPDEVAKGVLLYENATIEETAGLVLIEEYKDLTHIYGRYLKPLFGSLYSQDFELLFAGHQRRHGSVVLLPLVRHGCLIGSLNFGSYNPRRFVRGLGTEFLERLAGIVAICIENAVNLGRLRQLSLTDVLTGAHNRRSFELRLHEELARAEREDLPTSCLFLDIDFFKRINDEYGHRIGDRVLKETAGVIRLKLRNSDFLARYGGEEFILLLPNTDKQQATAIADRIKETVASKKFYSSEQSCFSVTISIGVATIYGTHLRPEIIPESAEGLVKAADAALYQAKAEGRNRVVSAGT